MNEDQIVGCILGTAVGDALGLPYEGLSRGRGNRLLGPPDRHRFLWGRGMISDDTEHTCIVAQSLLAAGGQCDKFQHALAWRLRWWLVGIPAGTGLATLRAILRLWMGVPPDRSGVFSAGNGPAMRAALFGLVCRDRDSMRELVRVSTRITHTDPKAEAGAMAVALAAQMAAGPFGIAPTQYLGRLTGELEDHPEFLELIRGVVASVERCQTTEDYAEQIGLGKGVSGYVYQSVPIALHAWLKNQRDYRSAVTSVIRCGGDTDSTAAIVGGIVGAGVGRLGIPSAWLDGIFEWPRTVTWMEALGRSLATSTPDGHPIRPPSFPVWGILPRNLFFLAVVLCHGLRRLAPPYS